METLYNLSHLRKSSLNVITRLCFIFLLISSFTITSSYGDIRRVNNQLTTNNSQKIYATLQEAHNFAAEGDTLMVEGSTKEYDVLEMTKRLTIIGTGYFLEENPNTSSSTTTSNFRTIRVRDTAKGSSFIGIVFSNSSSFNKIEIGADEIFVSRSYLLYGLGINSTVKNIKIIQNYFPNNNSGFTVNSSFYGFSDITFSNNFHFANFTVTSTSQGVQRTFSSIENNIFGGTVNVTTTTFRNNIITSQNNTYTINSNNNQNNLFRGNNPLATINGNQIYNENQLFVGPTSASTDGQYVLKSDSPYLTAGYQGAQPGIFGGNTPYVLSGIPAIPSIYELDVATFGSQENGLNIKIKAKTNN